MSTGKTEEEAKKQAPIIIEAQNASKMEEQEMKVIKTMGKKMNQWVYDGCYYL
jgi:arginyl-tRNA synthetase